MGSLGADAVHEAQIWWAPISRLSKTRVRVKRPVRVICGFERQSTHIPNHSSNKKRKVSDLVEVNPA